MIKQIYNNNFRINYKIEGKGNPIVLIHGFLETSETWADFSKLLSERFTVISVDLPGHGKSELFEEPYSMCKYAESIYHILNEEKIPKAILTGHSMGGYVALAFAENYPYMLSGLCLFHSTPFADSKEKMKARTETINQIITGNKEIICKNHAKAVYADENIGKFTKEISEGEKIALSVSDEGIVASLLAMKDRKDRNDILEKLQVPFLYIQGKKDRFIPENVIHRINMPENFEVSVLDNSGHTGFTEEKEKSLKLINDFANKVYS